MPLRDTLKGITVLDLTTNLPGPLATQMLGDFGANVIKIESLIGDPVRYYPPFIDQESQLNLLLNRNKRSIAIDLKQRAGLDIFNKLVKTTDIVIVGFRPSTVKKLKIDFETLCEINPSIIYVQLTGYGSKDNRVGHDLNYIGEAGILNLTGPEEHPIVPGVPIADIGGGSLPTVITVLGALLKRTEKAQYFDISMVDHLFPWLSVVAAEYLAGLGEPQRTLHALSGYIPWYRIYETKDKKFVSFAPLEAKFWENFCQAIGRDDLIDKQYNLELCDEILPKIFLSRSTDEWEEIFVQFEIPGGLILTLEESFKKQGIINKLEHHELGEVNLISSPYLNRDSSPIYEFPPILGQHTEEILTELGMVTQIEQLRKDKVILTPDPD